MNGSCAWARTALGVYVLGAIEPAERFRVEEHLAGCRACRDELAGLAGLPALLGRVDERQVAGPPAPPPELLESLLDRAAAERRRRRMPPWGPLSVAACVLLVVGILFGGFLMPRERGAALPSAPPTPSSTAPPPASPSPTGERAKRVAATDPRTGVKGYAVLHKEGTGTRIELHVSGEPRGECRLRVVVRDGRDEQLATWRVEEKSPGRYSTYTRFPREQLASLEITTLDGRKLLVIPA